MIQFLVALLPALLLVFHIYKADRLQPEPWSQLKRAFGFGILSIVVSFCFSIPLSNLGFFSDDYTGWTGALRLAFFGAAVPEELAKFLMLWLVVRRNKYFDEKMDGIVYAVCVGMGFAAFENVTYLFGAGDEWLSMGMARAFMAVPCHYYLAVFMGYFFSLYWFERDNKMWNLFWTLAAPILAHTLYDFLLMYIAVTDSEVVISVLSIILFVSCFQFLKWSRLRISQHLMADEVEGYLKREQSATDDYDRSDRAY